MPLPLLAIPFPAVDPVLIAIGPFAIRWYALAYILGIVLGWRLVRRLVLRPGWRVTPEAVDDLVFYVTLGVILGGRLGYVLFYQPGHYLDRPLELLAVWRGGMSFHGGLIGVLVATYLFARKRKLAFFELTDALAVVTPIGLCLGRIANFINAELWGRPTRLTWGVAFPGEAAQTCPDIVGLCGRHPSQLYEAVLEGLILGALLLTLAFRRGWLKFPGRLMGLFVAGYGLARFLVEFVRQPDPQFIAPGNPLGLALHLNGWGLTMGQRLSLPMIAVGLWLSARSRAA